MNRAILRSHGFTLVELLVVIAIIAILVFALLPALGSVREMARRSQCENRAMKLGMAVQRYELANGCFPPGVINPDGPIVNRPEGIHQGWIGQVLPYLDRASLYEHLDVNLSVYAVENQRVRSHTIIDLLCPSDRHEVGEWPPSNFAGNHHDEEAPIDEDNHGILFLNSRTRIEDITDGTEFTLLFGEKLRDLHDSGWLAGTRATLRNTGAPLNATPVQDASESPAALPLLAVGGYGSDHPGGAHMGLADGSVRFLSRHIDPKIWQQMGHRSDGPIGDETVFE